MLCLNTRLHLDASILRCSQRTDIFSKKCLVPGMVVQTDNTFLLYHNKAMRVRACVRVGHYEYLAIIFSLFYTQA